MANNNTITRLFERINLNEATYKGVITKFDNKGNFYFTYTDKANKVYEVKKASIKYYYSETLQKGIAFLNGAFKDALPIVYTSEKKTTEGENNLLLIQCVEAYTDKDKMPVLHEKVLEALEPIIRKSLKTSLKEGKIYSSTFFHKCALNGSREIGSSYEDKEGFRHVVGISTTQAIGIFRALEKMSPEDREAIQPIMAEITEAITQATEEVTKHNEEVQKALKASEEEAEREAV